MKKKANIVGANKMILLSIVFVIIYWFVETTIDVFVFHSGTFGEMLFQCGFHEMWTRLLVVSLLIAFGIIGQMSIARNQGLYNKLQKSETNLSKAQSMAHMGSWEWDVRTHKLVWSDETFRIFGSEPGTFVPTNEKFMSYVHPNDQHLITEANKRLDQGESLYSVEHRIVLPDGSEKHVHELAEVDFDDSGAPVKIYGTVQIITEKKHAEKILVESEKLHSSIFQQAPLGIATIDSQKRTFLSVNRKFTDIVGWSHQEMLATDFKSITYPDDLQEDMDYMVQLVEGKIRSFNMEKRYIHKNGSIVWVNLMVVPLWRCGESPVCHLAMIEDITERKKDEKLLRELNCQLKTSIDTMPVAYIMWDTDFRVKDWNHTAEEIFGYTQEEMIGKPAVDYIVPENIRPTFVDTVGNLKKGEIADYSVKNNCMRKDGSLLSCQWIATPFMDSEGCITGILSMSLDITNRLKAEEAKKESDQRLHAILVAMPDMVFRMRLDGIFLDYKGPGEELLVGSKILVGSNISESSLPQDIIENTLVLTNEVIKTGETHSFEYEVPSPIGMQYYESRIVKSGNDEVICFVRNVTRQKLIEKERETLEIQLSQAQKMEAIGSLVAGIAHEFNNILGAIMLNAEMLLMLIQENEMTHENANEIMKSSHRAKHLVDKLLTFSRQSKPIRHPIDISLIANDTINRLRSSLPATIDLRLNIQPDSDMILGDSNQIHQLIMNLCSNAVEAIGDSSGVLEVITNNVTFETKGTGLQLGVRPGKYVELYVNDTGAGIDSAIRDRIFEPFFTTKNVGEGPGLGLSVVHGIIKEYGGTINVVSETGNGTSVAILVPTVET